MMVQPRSVRVDGTEDGPWEALNEAVVEKAQGHTARLTVDFDGAPLHQPRRRRPHRVHAHRLHRVRALGPGGTVVEPQFRCLQLTMVAPHMLFDRSLVARPVHRRPHRDRPPAPSVLTMDGRTVARLAEGDDRPRHRSRR